MGKQKNKISGSKVEKRIKVFRFKKELGFITTPERSGLMSKISGSDTKPELKLRKGLWALGFRYRINFKKLPGKPDIVMQKRKIAIFIDGEFWHGYDWKTKKSKIKANRGFWIPKIERNMQRDKANNIKLQLMGYRVKRFWAHEVLEDVDKCLREIFEMKSNL